LAVDVPSAKPTAEAYEKLIAKALLSPAAFAVIGTIALLAPTAELVLSE
jgi:hypothetical protein